MARPTITPIPTPPQRGEGQADFTAKGDAMLGALPTFVVQMNALIGYVQTQAGLIDSSVTSAQAAAASAAQVLATMMANSAAITTSLTTANAAAAASRAAIGAPAIVGKVGSVLMVTSTGQLDFSSEMAVGDVLITDRNPGGLYLPANAGLRAQSSYPALFGALGLLGGQAGLTWSTVTPGTSGNGVDISSNQNSGVVIEILSTAGGIQRSTDRGATWSAATISGPAAGTMTAISCDGNGTWLITTTTGVVYRSTDDGLTWAAVTVVASLSLARVSNDGNGTWIVVPTATNTSVYRSADNGLTWTASVTGTTMVHATVATDGKGVWIVTGAAVGRRSIDNGLTWANVLAAGSTISGLATDRNGIWMASGTSSSSNTYRSVDNGLTWFLLAATGTTTAVTDITYSMGFFFLVVSATRVIMISANPDSTVYFQPSMSTGSFGKITHAGKGVLITTITTSSAVLRSVPTFGYDTGTLFRLPDFPVAPGLAAWIKAGMKLQYGFSSLTQTTPLPNSARKFCTSGSGVIMAYQITGRTLCRSVDGGNTWTSVTPSDMPATVNLNSMATDGLGTWLLVGSGPSSALVLRSVDDGLSWTALTGAAGTNPIINSVAFGAGVFIMGGSASARRSTDLGATWSTISITSVRCVATDKAGTWLISGPGVSLYRSTDNGANYVVNTPPAAFDRITMADNGVVLAASYQAGAAVYRSVNGGLSNWVSVTTLPAGATIGDVKLNKDGFGLLTFGSSPYIRYTQNYGVNWATLATPLTPLCDQIGGGDTDPWIFSLASDGGALITAGTPI